MRPDDTSQEAHAVQLAAYRRMGPAARLQVGLELTELSRRLLLDGIRTRHPEYSDEELRLAMIRLWLGREQFTLAYPTAPELEP